LVDSATREPSASPTRPSLITWSTDAIPERERFAFWRDAVCRAVFNISIEAPPERLSARISARTSGPMRLATSESVGAYQLTRSRQHIASAPSDHYSIFLQQSGCSVINHSDETVAVQSNDLTLYDGRLPFDGTFFNGKRTIAVIPREMIDRRAPWLRQRPFNKFASNGPFVDLARRHLLEIAGEGAMLNDGATALLTENLCNLLTLASATDIAPNRLQSELQVEAALAFCRRKLHDAELSPQLVADYLGISVRTLHLRFQQIGQTFGTWVLEHRLKACGAALRDPNQQTLNISEIAYRWGFNDLSYFNKAFRAHFDMTPREWRNGLGATS
jgi:AraC family transcriptional activator of tynA and feaB